MNTNPTSVFGGYHMERDYTLMNKNTPLVSFHLVDIGQEMFTLSDIKHLGDTEFSDTQLKNVLLQKKPAKNREYLDKLLNLMQIKSITGYLDISYGLSLNDTLWIKPTDASDDINWANLNLYENEFNETIAHFAFCGQGMAGMHMKTTSPEFGTNGMLPKCWHREDDGEIYLYKGGTSGCSNTGNEPYSEYMASALLDAMKMPNYVQYTLKTYHNSLVSSCKLFTSQDYGYLPVCNYFNPSDFLDVMHEFEKLGLKDAFEDLMVFDALIYNTDRHLNNYGFIVDNATFEIQGMAPIFDNGLGLFPYYTMDKDLTAYAAEQDYQNCGIPNDDVFALCLKDRHKKMLRSLADFKFPKHPLFDLPPERIERIENFLQQRIQYILSK